MDRLWPTDEQFARVAAYLPIDTRGDSIPFDQALQLSALRKLFRYATAEYVITLLKTLAPNELNEAIIVLRWCGAKNICNPDLNFSW